MRLIDVDKIYQDVEEALAEKKGDFANGIPYEWAWTLTVLGAQPTIEQPKWISCGERLPEDDERNRFYDDRFLKFTSVLGYDKEGGIRILNRIKVDPCGIDYIDRLSTDGWRWSYRGENVTHWMPLPQPPKGDE